MVEYKREVIPQLEKHFLKHITATLETPILIFDKSVLTSKL